MTTPDRAREAARRRPAARRRRHRSPARLPLTLKESTRAAGLPQSAGIPAYAGFVPDTDGIVARRVFEAGGCLLGTTNIPFSLSDWQADSAVYGRTNNPWDLGRSPGGRRGRGGATGDGDDTTSDRQRHRWVDPGRPFWVYGHRPTETAIPRSGSLPPHDLDNPAAIMGVQGPLARSAADLELMFDVVAGPVAWKTGHGASECHRHVELDGFAST
ncbi:MAG: amidase family protein [Ilumatobacteraceae bacterium]